MKITVGNITADFNKPTVSKDQWIADAKASGTFETLGKEAQDATLNKAWELLMGKDTPVAAPVNRRPAKPDAE